MTAKQQPPNSELLREIKTMQTAIVKIDGRVEALEIDKIATDASHAAVERYKQDILTSKEAKTKAEVFQALLPFIVALTALAYGIITYIGRVK
jgi:hypothetical protein